MGLIGWCLLWEGGVWATLHASGWSWGTVLGSAYVAAWDCSWVTPLNPEEGPRLHPAPALDKSMGIPKASQLSLLGRTLPSGFKPWGL